MSNNLSSIDYTLICVTIYWLTAEVPSSVVSAFIHWNYVEIVCQLRGEAVLMVL